MNINIQNNHVTKCIKFASFRRTLTQALRLLELIDSESAEYCSAELLDIMPTIEALQMAIREAQKEPKT